MLSRKYDEILEQFKRYYSSFHSNTVDWWPSGRFCITVKMNDGMLFEYNTRDNTIKRIQTEQHTIDNAVLRKEIGYNLQKVISARGLPQSEIASRCGITEAMLSRYIHGTSMPGIDKVYSLADVLGCRITDILDDKYDE